MSCISKKAPACEESTRSTSIGVESGRKQTVRFQPSGMRNLSFRYRRHCGLTASLRREPKANSDSKRFPCPTIPQFQSQPPPPFPPQLRPPKSRSRSTWFPEGPAARSRSAPVSQLSLGPMAAARRGLCGLFSGRFAIEARKPRTFASFQLVALGRLSGTGRPPILPGLDHFMAKLFTDSWATVPSGTKSRASSVI